MKVNEFLKEDNHEASMAKAELLQIAKNAMDVFKLVNEGDDLPGWVSSYISVANDHMNSVHEHLEYKQIKIAETASAGGTSSGGVATAMNGNGFANGGPGTVTRVKKSQVRKKKNG